MAQQIFVIHTGSLPVEFYILVYRQQIIKWVNELLSPRWPPDAIFWKQYLFDRFCFHRFFRWQSLSSEPGIWPFTASHVRNVQGYREIPGVIFGSFRCIHVGREKPLLVQSQPTARD